MSREKSIGLVAGTVLAVLGIGALVILASLGTYTETSALPQGELPEPGSEGAFITGKSRSGGTSIVGFHFGRTTHLVNVSFLSDPGCFEQVDVGDPWPTPLAGCTSPLMIAGEIVGGGFAATGESLVQVATEVSGECFAAVETGDPWPPDDPRCVRPSSDVEQAQQVGNLTEELS